MLILLSENEFWVGRCVKIQSEKLLDMRGWKQDNFHVIQLHRLNLNKLIFVWNIFILPQGCVLMLNLFCKFIKAEW